MAQQGSAGALLEEIVTTVRKRSNAEIAQDVPIAVTAFGAAQIEALFVKKLDDLSFIMPNVQLEAVGTFPGVQNFSIRGQGINSSIPSVDPTVGVFVDGVFWVRATASYSTPSTLRESKCYVGHRDYCLAAT